MTTRLEGPPPDSAIGPEARRRLLARADRLLRCTGHPAAELSLVLVDDATIAALNEAHRGRQGPTDVLSFSLLEGPHADFRGALLGDVVIGVDVARRQACEHGVSLEDELLRLLIHGVLHLLGHDHVRPEEARVMQREEERLWQELRG